ncbi:CHAT domain-containing protein [Kitasatospora sp. NPDC058201]|uniref:CHAT domain-containing protein n=1 Tax=unclassified Kitasatospora TaxID=2633591 RepID=UPI0036605C09
MTVLDEAAASVARGRRLLDEYDAEADPRRESVLLSGALTAFASARGLLERAGAAAPAQASAEVRFLLGLTLSVRYWRAAAQPDFAEDQEIRSAVLAERTSAVELLTLAVALLDPGAPERAEAAGRLGLLLHVRHEDVLADASADGDARADDLDRAVEALRLACPVPVPPGPWRALAGRDPSDEADYDDQDPGFLANLGCALADRHDRDLDPADLAAASAVLEGVLDGLRPPPWTDADGPPFRPAPDAEPGPVDLAEPLELAVRERLALLLVGDERRVATPEQELRVERAVMHLELIAATSAPDDPYRLRASLSLIDRYWERCDGTIRPEDVDHRLARLRDLRRLLPPEHELGGTVRWLLGGALAGLARLDRYVATEEARESVEVLREGLAGMAGDDPVRPASHAMLGTMVNAMREHDPETYRTEEAAHHLTVAVDSMQEEDHGIRRSDILQQLAHASIVQGEFSTDLGAVDRVIGLLDESRAKPSDTQWSEDHLHGSLAAAMSKRFALTNEMADLDAAIRHERAAFRRAAPDDVNRAVYLENLSVSLYQRFLLGGDYQDLEASRRYHAEVLAFLSRSQHAGVDRLVARELPTLQRTRLMLEFQDAMTGRDTGRMGRVVAELEPLVAAVPVDDPLYLLARGDLGAVTFMHALFTAPDRIVEAVGLMVEAAEETPAGHLHKAVLTMRAASALGLLALYPVYSEHRVGGALTYLDELDRAVDPASLEGTRGQLLRAMLLMMRYRHARLPADAVAALAAAGAVRDRLRRGSPTQLLAAATMLVARVHRQRLGPDDRRLGREFGLAALRETAAATLLQAAAAPALVVARDAAAQALSIAHWCLADLDAVGTGEEPGEPSAPDAATPHLRAAVEVLELGRGLVLHASTTTTDVPDLLRAAGHEDLAAAWAVGGEAGDIASVGSLDALLGLPGTLLDSLPGGAAVPMPDDLRRRAVAALADSPAGTLLMAPPSVEEIARSLRAAGADGLVYLLPPGEGRSGQALLVTAAGTGGVELVPLSLVSSDALGPRGPLTAYRRAHVERQATLGDHPAGHPDRIAARRRWQATLAELCDWSGTAVLRPLLRHPALRSAGSGGVAGGLPRLVLVPFGEFGGVPWHAALLSSGLRDGSRPVRALERAVLSYAASARQFCEVVGRPRLPLGERPVIVGDPTRELMFAEVEAEYLHADYYPHGTLLGYVEGAEGAGTAREVLAALPAPGRAGASVLHLACHALPSGGSPLDAYLGLAPEPGPVRSGAEDAGRAAGQDGQDPARSGRLPVGDILRQAQGRPPGSPGGLVVLDACVSDHTGGDLDEALTLSTAFVAAGATGVIGSRWEVVDEMVCVLMYVFHGRLAEGDPPAEALRRTQLWALRPDRRLPPGAPAELVALARRDTAALDVWAAFAYQGA